MARGARDGLLYFSFDTDFFSDRKIKSVKAHFGADGVVFYIYLLCEVYRDKGYYLRCEDDFLEGIADDLGMSIPKIGQMMNFLLERSLFDGKLFQSDKVLTSRGIQKRYQRVVEAAARKTPRKVDAAIWLLEEDDTKSFIQCARFADSSGKTAGISEKNAHAFSENTPKGKEIKEKKIEENETEGAFAAAAETVFKRFEERFGREADSAFRTTAERLLREGMPIETALRVLDDAAGRGPRNPESYIIARWKLGGDAAPRPKAPAEAAPTGALQSWETEWLAEMAARKKARQRERADEPQPGAPLPSAGPPPATP